MKYQVLFFQKHKEEIFMNVSAVVIGAFKINNISVRNGKFEVDNENAVSNGTPFTSGKIPTHRCVCVCVCVCGGGLGKRFSILDHQVSRTEINLLEL